MKETEVWPYTGCIVPAYPKLNPMDENLWPTFWKIFAALRQPDAGNIKRPPL
jgi:putative transposase